VYSTAIRLVEGDTHRAKDVAQTVFVDLARTAARLSPNSCWRLAASAYLLCGPDRHARRTPPPGP